MDSGWVPNPSGPEEACVAAALVQLNGTLTDAGANLVKLLDAAGTIATEIRNGVNLVDTCMDTFVRPKMRLQGGGPTETTPQEEGSGHVAIGVNGKETHSQVVQGAETSAGPISEETNPVYVPDLTPLLPVLRGECSDDTVMMGSMIQLEQVRTRMGGERVQPLSIPSVLRGKLQGRLGDEVNIQRTSSDGCYRPTKIQKVIDLTPEEKKRSNKIAVTFPSVSTPLLIFIRCKFKITPQHKYSFTEAQYLAYIFGSNLEPNEVQFHRGQRKMDREDLATLLLGNEPSNYIMEMMAYKTA
ncbi:hypothetical protein PIB30_029616 [Stylosanthes scabra]|uniref:Uncharacterized protein n=1 Tax=Stylosanthes scabra TaxID=79078 RepID=A0ABU6QAR3_9FABA|nr:hypothetical protein [Stylosanthes scabra]